MPANKEARLLAMSGRTAPEWGLRPMSPTGVWPSFITYQEAQRSLDAMHDRMADDPIIEQTMIRVLRMTILPGWRWP
jgi:hypothetical protein